MDNKGTTSVCLVPPKELHTAHTSSYIERSLVNAYIQYIAVHSVLIPCPVPFILSFPVIVSLQYYSAVHALYLVIV
jgi:hypothetical protein